MPLSSFADSSMWYGDKHHAEEHMIEAMAQAWEEGFFAAKEWCSELVRLQKVFETAKRTLVEDQERNGPHFRFISKYEAAFRDAQRAYIEFIGTSPRNRYKT